eukprot:CAMPEP_0183740844 /NCGR_PEP_ID=MMETSP0737-20130205/60654_1 /TAXON_ID=385413 /ORGANISM="Thalassiosira miniscula, Strain CCMP1093" /LENGTH=156 /DNA_ID=CAMNT_0025975999 /DNA_START=138 /DNA_END=608 /DNA_ORIENTATION=+
MPDIPVRAVRRMDGYGGSGVTLMFSDHLGMERLIPHAKMRYACDYEFEALECARAMLEEPAEAHVTSPVDPDVMRLKPAEAAFNTEKYPEAFQALLENGIITDTGKRVQIGLYPNKFPICRIYAPQMDNAEDNRRARDAQMEMFQRMGLTTMRMGS